MTILKNKKTKKAGFGIKKYLIENKKKVAIFLVILIAGYLLYSQFTKETKGIETAKVKKDTIVESFTANGETKARKMADLKFMAPGRVSWVGVKNGDTVGAYQAVASLDKTSLNASYKQALNNIRMYEATVASVYDSLQGKEKTETFSERDIRTQAEVAKDNAYDQAIAAKNALSHATLISPIRGTVFATNGLIAGLNITGSDLETKYIRVVDTSSMYFEAEIDSVDFAKVEKGQKVSLNFDAFAGEVCEGEVTFINKSGEKTAGGVVTYMSDVNLTDCKLDLGVYLNGQANFVSGQKENVLIIPKKYIVIKDGDNYVWKQSGQSTKQRELVRVEPGISNSENIEIKVGLSEGDTVIFLPN